MTPVERLNLYIAEGRLIRQNWIGRLGDGRETACILAALAPECGRAGSASACPADIMPQWLAHLTVWIDDFGSLEAWPGMVRRYAGIAARWHVLSPNAWKQLGFAARRICVEEAAAHHNRGAAPAVKDLMSFVIALCRRAEAGDFPTVDEWKAVLDADASCGAAVIWAVADFGLLGPRAVVEAAKTACEPAHGFRARTACEPVHGFRAAADRITAAILDAIEAKIVEVEV